MRSENQHKQELAVRRDNQRDRDRDRGSDWAETGTENPVASLRSDAKVESRGGPKGGTS